MDYKKQSLLRLYIHMLWDPEDNDKTDSFIPTY